MLGGKEGAQKAGTASAQAQRLEASVAGAERARVRTVGSKTHLSAGTASCGALEAGYESLSILILSVSK